MRTDQREAVLVIANGLYGDSPSFDGVARFAIGSELPTMQVGVAVGAFLPDVCEHRFHMALRACHLFMHASQGIFRAVVIEFRDAADRLPTQRRMTVFAGNIQRAVRVSCRSLWHTTLRHLAMDLERAQRQNEKQQSSTEHVGSPWAGPVTSLLEPVSDFLGDPAHYSPRSREVFLKMADWIFETVSSRAGLIASLGVLSLSTNCTGVQFPGRLGESHLFPRVPDPSPSA